MQLFFLENALENEFGTNNETTTLYHLRLGKRITIFVNKNGEKRSLTISKIEDLPSAYDQIAKSLKTGNKLETFKNMNRKNITSLQKNMNRNRIKSEKITYAKLGFGALSHKNAVGNVNVGFGYRREFDEFGLDIGFLNFMIPSTDYNDEEYSGDSEWIKLAVMYFFDPYANSSFYVSGGTSYGYSYLRTNKYYDDYSNSGLRANLTLGYSTFRISNIRFYTELEGIIPFYELSNDDDIDTSKEYAMILKFSLVAGW